MWEGWTGWWVGWCLWELCCWSLDSCNPRDPTPTPEKPGGLEITLFSASLPLILFGVTVLGKSALLGVVAPASTALLWRAVGRVAKVTTNNNQV